MTIRRRLTIQFSVIVGVLLVSFSLSVYFFSSGYRQQEFFTRLEDKAETAARLLLDVEAVDESLLRIINQNSRDLLPEELIAIYDVAGNMTFKTKDSELQIQCDQVASKVIGGANVKETQGSRQFVGFKFKRRAQQFIVVAAAYDKYGYSKLSFLKSILIFSCLFAEALTILLGWVYARQALSPINDLIRQVRELSASKLSMRVRSRNEKDELANLASEFNQMLDRLEAAFELQRSFVSNASHELRTPLTSITGEISLALFDGKINEEGTAVLKSVYQEIRNLNRLANGLLDLAQVDLDASGFQVEKFRIDELLGSCQAEVVKFDPKCEILLEIEEFPEDESQLMVFGNEQLLLSAISNAIENACKYSTPPRARVKLRFEPSHLILVVEDEGIGVPREDLPHIFEAFYRASNSKGFRGHGIGLALTKKIVELHKGTIEIQSSVGEGTMVTIKLPSRVGGEVLPV